MLDAWWCCSTVSLVIITGSFKRKKTKRKKITGMLINDYNNTNYHLFDF